MIKREGQRLVLEGAVTLATHVALREASAKLFDADEMVVDWSAVDSSALSLILYWHRNAAAAGRRLRQEHLPAGLTALAALYGVSSILEAT